MRVPLPALLVQSLWSRYVGASVIALAVDLASYFALIAALVPAGTAAAAGYALGIIVHWLLSTRGVFANGMALAGAQRLRSKALFVASALVGLVLTVAVVSIGAALGAHVALAKLVAVMISFQTTYWLRKRIVFAP